MIYEVGSKQKDERLLGILDYLANKQMPVKPTKVSDDLMIPLSTTIRYLNSLASQGFVFKNDSGEYGATWLICKIGDAIKSSFTLKNFANEFMLDLAVTHKVAVSLAIIQDSRLVYLDFIDSPNDDLRTFKRIGIDAPLYTTGSGKILLSSLNQVTRDKILDGIILEPLTKKTIANKSELKKEIEKVGQQSYAIDDEECEEGYRCVCVPILDYSSQVIAAISAIDIVEKMSNTRIKQEILPALRTASKSISFRLGYSGPCVIRISV